MRLDNSRSRHRFGGNWTEQKLAILKGYIGQYHRALKHQRFSRYYIDAFAGTGYIDREPDLGDNSLFINAEAGDEGTRFVAGSAVEALRSNPPFDQYVFIDNKPAHCEALSVLRRDFPELSDRITIRNADANEAIEELCADDWSNRRALLFLDPYGAQVRWRTIEAIARTRAIDLWLLFPLVAVIRMLPRTGEIPEAWRHRLDELLGVTNWYETFYTLESEPSLFDDPIEKLVKANSQVITEFFVKRLTGCFAEALQEPKVLYNSRRSPLYLLCFAAANPAGAPIAVRIARGVIKKMSS